MWKIKGICTIVFVCITSVILAQSSLKIQGTSPDLYLVHKVQPKETWYSIGRLYNLSPKTIAPFNNATLETTLQINQDLKIPLVNENFSQDGRHEKGEVFLPLYHTVEAREWMYRISQHYNKVPVTTLESWNNIKNDDLKVGMELIVGYLKVKLGQSDLASRGTSRIVPATSQPVVKNDPPAVIEKKEQTAQAETVKEEKQPETAVVSNDRETATPASSQPENSPIDNAVHTSSTNYKGGYFRSGYNGKNGRKMTGNAGIFRSTSGWKDGKYYALMNDVPVGTIVKVTFPSTNKSIYAKVLGQLPDMKESVGLTMRISDAASAELGAELGKFYVEAQY